MGTDSTQRLFKEFLLSQQPTNSCSGALRYMVVVVARIQLKRRIKLLSLIEGLYFFRSVCWNSTRFLSRKVKALFFRFFLSKIAISSIHMLKQFLDLV